MSNKQIAAELYLSPATVERHLATIYRKLGLAGRVEAARYALAHGLAATMSYTPGCYNAAARRHAVGTPAGATWLPGFGGPAPPRTR